MNDIPCATCGTKIPRTKAHRFEEVLPGGREKEYSVCSSCCPNCFGGVGNDGSNTDPKEPPTLTIP